ncbi:MAG: gamma-glutamyltransferase family protein [Croceibacterium sp.]
MLHRIIAVLAAPLLLGGCTAVAPVSSVAAPAPTQGAAAANDPRAGAIGESILRKGGSATDAGIAMLLALSVIEPQSTGLGGGGFYVHGAADGTVDTIDGRETAPAAAGPAWFLDGNGKPRERRAAILSGLSTGVPGNVALAAEAWRRHGKLPWADLFAPAIALARDGFAVTPRLSGSLASNAASAARDPAGKALFYRSDGRAPGAGSIVRLPALAETLAMIARAGPQSFYSGPFAAGLAARVASDTPGSAAMTAEDLARYKATERPPVCVIYRLYRLCTMGPPSSGGYAVLATLKLLERFDLAALGPRNPQTWHLFLEAQRLAYADRARWVGDPRYVAIPIAGLLDPGYLSRRSALIDSATAMASAVPGDPPGAVALSQGEAGPEHGTTHFVAVDRHGDMVGITSTVESAFGSGLVYRGFYLNNELTDFAFLPGDSGRPAVNAVAGGKRPASSMAPVVVYDPQGRPFLTIGAAGGGLIPVETARALIGVIDFHLPLRDALGLPFAMSVGRDTVLVEKGTWMETLGPAFLALGHDQVTPFGQLLRTTGALHTDAGWIAAFDPRLDSLVAIPATPQDDPAVGAGFSEGQ